MHLHLNLPICSRDRKNLDQNPSTRNNRDFCMIFSPVLWCTCSFPPLNSFAIGWRCWVMQKAFYSSEVDDNGLCREIYHMPLWNATNEGDIFILFLKCFIIFTVTRRRSHGQETCVQNPISSDPYNAMGCNGCCLHQTTMSLHHRTWIAA